MVTFHYHNNTNTKGSHNTGWKPVYVHKTKTEMQTMRAPAANSGYKADVQSAPLSYFCPFVLKPMKLKTQVNFTATKIKQALQSTHRNRPLHDRD